MNADMISEKLWSKVEPLLPARPKPKGPGGRPRIDPRRIFSGVIYVLRTGCQWKEAPRVYGAGSTIHVHYLTWARAGVFQRLWQTGLAEYDEMEGIAWKWQAADGAMTKAPLGGEKTGPNPTDRGKKRREAECAGGRAWSPAVDRRRRSERQRPQAA